MSVSHRVRMFQQSEVAECGLACLAMVASCYDNHLDLFTLRRRFPGSGRGLTMARIAQHATALGMVSRGLRAEPQHLGRLRHPAILHWGMDHFVVLVKVRGARCVIHDPATGRRVVGRAEVDAQFTGVALELWPGNQFQASPKQKRFGLSSLWVRLGRPLHSLLIVFALTVFLQLFALAGPWHVQWSVDEALISQDLHLLGALAIGFSGMCVVKFVTAWLRGMVVLKLGHQMSFQLASQLLQHLLRLPLGWFETRHLGDISSRFSSLMPVRDFFVHGAAAIIVDGAMVVFSGLLMLLYHPELALLVMVIHLILALIGLSMVAYLKRLGMAQVVAQAQESTQLLETIRAIMSVKVFDLEVQRQTHWQKLHGHSIDASMRQQGARLHIASIHQLVGGLELVLVVYLAGLAVTEQQMSIGMLFAFVSYRDQFTSRLGTLIDQVLNYRTLEVHFERLNEIWSEPIEHEPTTDRLGGLRAQDTSVVCAGVGFRYQDHGPWLIRHLDLRVEAGEFIALVGASGVGKSSLLKLLMGLNKPQEGVLNVGGIALSRHNLQDYRQKIACVLQDDILFKGSVLENITLGLPLDEKRLQTVVTQVDLQEALGNLPMAYATQVGEIGHLFSAGQKQRLLLARALYKSPDYLFLDEGTANLDGSSASSIARVLARLTCTRVIVTHDLQVAKYADRTLSVDEDFLLGNTASQAVVLPGRQAG
ncbi:MAG: peptidase domain-containing ABC transporter [Pseudomonadota bacterium]